jgi:hypothetical protein
MKDAERVKLIWVIYGIEIHVSFSHKPRKIVDIINKVIQEESAKIQEEINQVILNRKKSC